MTANDKAAVIAAHAEDLALSKDNQENNTKSEDAKNPAPDGGYGWVVLFGSFLISFILDGVMYSFGLIYNEIKSFYQAPDEIANLIISFNTGFLFCSGPIVAGLANQFGCRTVVMGGAIITSLMYFLTVFAPSIGVIMVTYGIVGGLSTGCTYIASLIIIAEYFDKKRGIATGITMAGSGVGSFVFAPLIQGLIKHFDWKFATSICSCIILQTCVCGALLRPLNPGESSSSKKPKHVELKSLKKQSKSHDHEDEDVAKTVQTYIGSVVSLNEGHKSNEKLPIYQRNKFLRISVGILKEMTDFKLLCENVPFLLITVSNFFIFSGYFITFMYMTKIADDNGIENSSWLISIIGIVNIPFRMLYGFIADKKFISAVNLNTLAVLISTAPLFFYPLLQYYFSTQAIFAFLFAVGIAGMNSLTTMYLVEIVGMGKFSNATGIVNLFRGFGCFIGPFLGGIIVEKFSKVTAFYYSGICLLIGLVMCVIVSFIMYFRKDNANPATANESNLKKNLIENKV